MKATIFFADTQVKEAFEALRASTRSEDRELVALLERAFVAISANAFCGTQVPKRQIPKNYLQRHPPIKNLWKYNLSRSWRLMYTVTSDGGTIAVVIEWLDHTNYDRQFGY
ncbi:MULTISPECIES: hypothetical protein [Methanoculleus]|jgi:hypothetical protein|uniref:Type II toxin-antitoxin system RelE/ParE family toxin n=1 Tax=Methanoculleus bourgensis TaxID=83986 RepID=A0A0X3BI70_9EURY|nr:MULTISPECIES: hypothetical protein [Methanoculleus]CVK31832.1 conserved protein of unknown function [Methanoculleus bourgensis]